MNNHNKIFNNIFQQSYSHTNKAHARVNLIGEHTDYTGGYVLPCLLQYKTVVSVAENKTSKTYNAYSEVYREKISFNDFVKSKNNQWVDYLKGCLFVFYDENKTLDNIYLNLLIQSNIPMRRGISSSSALCVAILKSLNDFFNIGYADKHIAILAQKVERNYIGVSGGIMDQMVSSIGIHGKAFFLDCLTLKYELIDLPNNYCFELVDSEVQRDNRKSAYNERHDQLKRAEEILNVENLGSVNIDQLNKNKIDDLLIYKRALHVVTENQRTKDAKNFMLKQDMKQFGHLMNLSHSSYSKDFEASTEEVDLLTKRSIESGALGCRLTGGGFGGFTVSLIAKKDYEQWYNNMSKYYSKDKFFKV